MSSELTCPNVRDDLSYMTTTGFETEEYSLVLDTDLSVASSTSIYWASLLMVIVVYNFR
jgi:hypothetical protein